MGVLTYKKKKRNTECIDLALLPDSIAKPMCACEGTEERACMFSLFLRGFVLVRLLVQTMHHRSLCSSDPAQ